MHYIKKTENMWVVFVPPSLSALNSVECSNVTMCPLNTNLGQTLIALTFEIVKCI